MAVLPALRLAGGGCAGAQRPAAPAPGCLLLPLSSPLPSPPLLVAVMPATESESASEDVVAPSARVSPALVDPAGTLGVRKYVKGAVRSLY